MFDVGWSELLIVGVVALLVVGPKDLPMMLRTIGKYMGMIKRQANEFRAQFDEAMREAELHELRKEVENIKTDAERTIRDAESAFDKQMSDMNAAGDHYEPVSGTSAGHDGTAKLDHERSEDAFAATAAGDVGTGSAAVAAAAAAAAAAGEAAAGKPSHSDQVADQVADRAASEQASGKENA
ncbi:MAG: Sec-independent protein translocase protein TatB [Hyphomicrobiaceae bacterium]